jgi:hypothetical protein
VSNVTRIRVLLAGQTERIVAIGAFSQIAAKRRYGLDTIREGDPEPVLYGVWIELEGPRPKGEDPEKFDEWLRTVEHFEIVSNEEVSDDDEDPPVAGSSASSPDSPPTSE